MFIFTFWGLERVYALPPGLADLVQARAPKANCTLYLNGQDLAKTLSMATGGHIKPVPSLESLKEREALASILAEGVPIPYQNLLWKNDIRVIEEFTLRHRDFSVRIHDLIQYGLFRFDYDLDRTLKAIYNMLVGKQLHLGDLRHPTKDRMTFEVVLKLQDITGEEILFNGIEHFSKLYVRGDKFNAWYHFLGVAISAMNAGELFTKSFLFVEKNAYSDNDYEDSEKMHNIHQAAIDFAEQLRKDWQRPKNERTNHLIYGSYSKPYLQSRPDIYASDYCLKPGQQTYEFQSSHATLTSYPSFMQKVYVFRSFLVEYLKTKNYENFVELKNVIQLLMSAPEQETVSPEKDFDIRYVVSRGVEANKSYLSQSDYSALKKMLGTLKPELETRGRTKKMAEINARPSLGDLEHLLGRKKNN